MKKLEYILEGVEVLGSFDNNIVIKGLTDDSRQVKEGFLFVADKGRSADGHDYVGMAIQNGASAVLYDDEEKIEDLSTEGVEMILLRNTGNEKYLVAQNFFNNPSGSFKLIGITGTNGKTTVASLLFQMFREMGFKAGLISTIEYRIEDERIPATHTTPDVITLNRIMSGMVEQECEYVVMEVSSHAVDQGRIKGLDFDIAAFTNVSHDHIAYHGSFINYINAKKKFFDDLEKNAIALVNIDDRNGKVMLQNTKAIQKSYGLKRLSDYKGRIISNTISGLEMMIDQHHVHLKLVGEFNAYNVMTVYAVAMEMFDNEMEVLRILSMLSAAEGRFDRIENRKRNIIGIVDYAHTPDALENVLKTLQELKPKVARIVTVVGCGGDRDKRKRPLMAEIAERLSDMVILTSDNPRSEDPKEIIAEMKTGLKGRSKTKVIDVEDRRKAIELANMMAVEGDIILIAGKGHEKYQIINGEKIPFDDKQILKSLFDKDIEE